ncbi:MAG: MATE family efflux transporter [Planctomycetota bacterium]|nr:MATE family efflux transporter [Planctomycetota bacterium]
MERRRDAACPAGGDAPDPESVAASCLDILRLAGPLILSTTGVMIMQYLDALFLAWYSKDALAAVVPAGMAGYMVKSVFIGAAGYTSTFVTQYIGAGRPDRVGAALWQGVYFSIASGLLVASLAPLAGPFFDLVGHDPGVREQEAAFFRISCLGAPLIMLNAAVSGFWSGRGATLPLMAVQLLSLLLNSLLAWVLIFGRFGLPRMGISGAAVATVAAQGFSAALLLAGALLPRHIETYGTWRGRRIEPALMWRLIKFGMPNGVRFAVEMVAWTLFLFLVGRIGNAELAATNIAWRINGIAFFPLIGLSSAISIIVGRCQGRGDPVLAAKATWRGMVMSQAWMMLAAVMFVAIPERLISMFHDPESMTAEEFARVSGMGAVCLRFVAAYCLLDGFNVVFTGALIGAGDTRWTLAAAAIMNVPFALVLYALLAAGMGLYALWAAATAFVMFQAIVWFLRFRSGEWKTMRVIEVAPPEDAGADAAG